MLSTKKNTLNIYSNDNFLKEQVKKILFKFKPFYLKTDKVFKQYYNFLQKSQWYAKNELEEYQISKLKNLINYAYNTIPYYRQLFDENRIRPQDIKDLNDFRKVPFLTKKIIKNNFKQLVSKNIPISNLEYAATSGSSGIPIGFYREKGRSKSIEKAFLQRYREWAGFNPSCQRYVKITGGLTDKKGKLLYYQDWRNNSLSISSNDLNEPNLRIIVKKIINFKPLIIMGYPSAIKYLANYIKKNNINLNLHSIFTSSETLYKYQRTFIENIFKCKIFDLYGHSERTVAAAECKYHQGYHIFPEYGIMEIIRKDGTAVKDEGAIGEVVGTGLHNYAMPLIRYKTGDFAVYTTKECGCERRLPLVTRFIGRLQEGIYSKDYRFIPITDLNMHSDVYDNIKEYQFNQNRIGEVVLKIVKNDNYTPTDSERILAELYKKCGNGIKINVAFVDYISRTKAGKVLPLIQKSKLKWNIT